MVEPRTLSVDLGWQLARRAIRQPDGRCTWLARSSSDVKGWRTGAVSLGPGVYDGLAGIALFLADLHRRTGQGEFADLARGALAAGLDHLSAIPAANRCSFYVGTAGFAWAGQTCARLLDEPALSEQANAIMRQEALQTMETAAIDLIQGASSGLPLFLSAWRDTGDDCYRAAAAALAKRLVRSAVWSGQKCSWPMSGDEAGVHLCGLSHGTAGSALALLAYNLAIGSAQALETAIGALDHEEAHYDRDQASWRDLRPGHGGHPSFWCHGAAGGALAHRRAADLLPEECEPIRQRSRARSDQAADRLARDVEEGTGSDCLCHGRLGNAWILSKLGRPVTRQVLASICDRMVREGPRSGLPDGGWTPGLMLGIAGMGLALLHLTPGQDSDPRDACPLVPPGID